MSRKRHTGDYSTTILTVTMVPVRSHQLLLLASATVVCLSNVASGTSIRTRESSGVSTVSVTAYASPDRSGDAVFSADLENSQVACQSIALQDGVTTIYGRVYCQDGQPTFSQCDDSDCTVCTPAVPLEPSGQCGEAWDYFASATGVPSA